MEEMEGPKGMEGPSGPGGGSRMRPVSGLSFTAVSSSALTVTAI
jgi:hypothetical protein